MGKRNGLLVWVVVVAMMALALPVTVQAQADGAKGKGEAKAAANKASEPKLSPHYNILASEAGLDDAQRAKLVAVIAERDAARKQNKEAAAKAGDDKELKTKLRDEAKAAEAASEAKMMALLKPEQAQKWRAYEMYFRQASSHGRAKMTDEQKAKARAMAQAIAAEQKVDGSTDRKTLDAAHKAYVAKVKEEVLTEEQRAELAKKPEPKAKPADDKAKSEEAKKK